MRANAPMIATVLPAALLGCLLLPACVDDDNVSTAADVEGGDDLVVRQVDAGGLTVATLSAGGTVLAELRRDGRAATYQEPACEPLTVVFGDPQVPLDRLIVHLWTRSEPPALYGARWCLKCTVHDNGSVTCVPISCPPPV